MTAKVVEYAKQVFLRFAGEVKGSILKKLTVIDLFSGCGGMSLGFQRAGYEILGGVESDARAAETYANNLHKRGAPDEIARYSEPKEIIAMGPERFCEEYLQSKACEGLVDVIIGGPPCQAFARIGRAKLRQIMDHEQAYLNDQRANLYTHFLAYVEKLGPKVVVLENVPEILNYGGKNIAEEIAATLNSMGYEPRYTLINAAHYGVPQTRVRFFLIAYHKGIQRIPVFPTPSHWAETSHNMYRYPQNRNGINTSQMVLPEHDVPEFSYYVTTEEPDPSFPQAASVKEAIGDCAPIYTDEIDPKTARRDFQSIKAYRDENISEYSLLMRQWPGFESDDGVRDHVIRFLPRDHEIFRRMRPGDQYPQAYAFAWQIFAEKISSMISNGDKIPSEKEKEFEGILRSCVPPYSVNKFPNKWQKLDADKPSHTITAHLGKDTYSHIHYDSDQARVISVREAARLQSFPDGFRFPPAMSHAYKQIGNAVPPWLSFKLAEAIKEQISSNYAKG